MSGLPKWLMAFRPVNMLRPCSRWKWFSQIYWKKKINNNYYHSLFEYHHISLSIYYRLFFGPSYKILYTFCNTLPILRTGDNFGIYFLHFLWKYFLKTNQNGFWLSHKTCNYTNFKRKNAQIVAFAQFFLKKLKLQLREHPYLCAT